MPAIDGVGLGIVRHHGGGDTTLIGIRFEVSRRAASMLLAPVRPLMRMQNVNDQVIVHGAIVRIMAETPQKSIGASLGAHHLAHRMRLRARLVGAREQHQETGRWFALAEPGLRAAISAMHRMPGHRWTVESLTTDAVYRERPLQGAFVRPKGCPPWLS